MNSIRIAAEIGAQADLGPATAGFFPIGFVKASLLGPLALGFGLKLGGADARLSVKALDLLGRQVGCLRIAVDLLPVGMARRVPCPKIPSMPRVL